ncbi:AlpA family phage regulatory protein [Rhodobacterales bacterium HKCCE3408]|nr:AlpA family phage regulatory protein [Rhodobacterales bacterium HKCCE3408]
MRYLSFRELQKKLGGRGRSSIYRDVEFGRLPKPIKFGARLYWPESDIDAAITACAEAAGDAAKAGGNK